MKKLKIGAVIYAPRVTVIWEMIEEFLRKMELKSKEYSSKTTNYK